MAIDSHHPEYDDYLAAWVKNDDCYAGQDRIKGKGTDYLPATAGQRMDGMTVGQDGYEAYKAFKLRARYHNFLSDAVENIVGRMHHKPPVIELPPQLEDIRNNATVNNESLVSVLRKINEQQLVKGRLGLLGDFPIDGGTLPLPNLAVYDAICLINWEGDGRPTMVNIAETYHEIGVDLKWEAKKQYRVLKVDQEGYKAAIFQDGDSYSDERLELLSTRGKGFDKIPFAFINAADLAAAPCKPPLDDLADLCLTLYRNEASYQQSLHMQGQDTLVTIARSFSDKNEGGDVRTGAGAHIDLDPGGDAKYIGVSPAGISEQRQAIENLKADAKNKSGQLLESNQKESGEALSVRVAAQTARLTQIAETGAAGLQRVLRDMAEWMGLDRESVIVRPNLDFAKEGMPAADIKTLQEAKNLGLVISEETIHGLMKKHDLTELDIEEERQKIRDEEI